MSQETKRKMNPKNREEAFVFQFEDDVKHLNSMAQFENENTRKAEFKSALARHKEKIAAYEELSK